MDTISYVYNLFCFIRKSTETPDPRIVTNASDYKIITVWTVVHIINSLTIIVIYKFFCGIA